MPTRSERQQSTDTAQKTRMSASEHCQKKIEECQKKEHQRSKSRSASSDSTSSSSSSSSSSSGTTSGTSSETGSSNSSSNSDSSSSSSESSDKMTAGSEYMSRGTVAAVSSNLQQQSSDEDNIQPRKRSPKCTRDVVDGTSRSPPSPAKPEVEIKATSGGKVADIVCLSPSKIEDQTTDECSVIPVEMISGSGENDRRNRIRIVLNGKVFPVSGKQLCVSESLRNISVYSDDEVDCNDDGRSLDRPLQRTIITKRVDQPHHASSKPSTESHRTRKCEVPQSKTDKVSTAEDSRPNESNDRKTRTASSSSEVQDIRLHVANVDDHSRSSQRRRMSAEGWTGTASSREERHGRGSSGRKSRSPDVGCVPGRSSLTSVWERRRRSERSDATIVAADRGTTTHHRTAAERHAAIIPRHETTRSGCRNKVTRSRSRSRSALSRDSKSRSPCRHNRSETGSSSRSRTKDHDTARTELDERQRRWSKHDVTSVSGRRSDRPISSRTRPDVENRNWRQDRAKVPHNLVPPTVPHGCRQTQHADRLEIYLRQGGYVLVVVCVSVSK